MSSEKCRADSENLSVDSGDWGNLPYVPLALIFSYLPDRDKFNASLVNRTWYESFSWPGNWRRREMIFHGICDDVIARENKFVEKFGSHLRSLRLRCWSPAQGSALRTYLKNLAGILDVVGQKAALREIHVVNVEGLSFMDDELLTVNDLLFENAYREEGKTEISFLLAKLIRNQRELRILDLEGVDFLWEIGVGLLVTAAKSAAANDTLHTLLLSGISSRLPRLAASSPEYISAMSCFKALTHLRLDYECLSSPLLHALGITLGNRFQKLMILYTAQGGPPLLPLEDDTWRLLVSRSPFLRVDLTIVAEGGETFGLRPSLLKSGMPLASLSLEGAVYLLNSDYWELTPFLELLFNEYRNTLEHLSLGDYQRFEGLSGENLNEHVVSMALRLKKLKTLQLSAPMDCADFSSIYDLLDKCHESTDLETLTLTAWCCSEEKMEELLTANKIARENRLYSRTEVRLVPVL